MPIHVNRGPGVTVYTAPIAATATQVLTTVDANDHVAWETPPDFVVDEFFYWPYGGGYKQQWTRPAEHKNMFIYCLGSGGGGGACYLGVGAEFYGFGGGGGGASSGTTWRGPALWPSLWIYTAVGGVGGAGNYSSGSPGELSYVSTQNTSTTEDLLVISGSVAAGGGGYGDGAGARGTAGILASSTSLGKLGTSSSFAGVLGGEGGYLDEAGHQTLSIISGPVSGGAGGAGANWTGPYDIHAFAGGAVSNVSSLVSAIAGGTAGGPDVVEGSYGGDGNNGYNYWTTMGFLTCGGSGGGSGYERGGNGGIGGWGSGGGGGGGSSSTWGSGTGLGGAGGGGIVYICSW